MISYSCHLLSSSKIFTNIYKASMYIPHFKKLIMRPCEERKFPPLKPGRKHLVGALLHNSTTVYTAIRKGIEE